jgi:hypothetical protein
MAKLKKYIAGVGAAAGAAGAAGKAGNLGGMMSGMDIGGMASSLGTSIAMLINANKKQDPTGRPYKTGTNMIKSKKSKLIKYQTGVNSTATGDPEDLNAYFGRVLGKNKTSSQVTQPQGEVGPTRKEAANLMRKYNQDIRNNPNVIGAIDEDAYKRSEDLTGLGITKPIMKSTPSSLLTPKQVSFTAPEQPSTSPRLNKVPIEKPSRRERRKENESFFKMANKQDIEYMTPRIPTLGENIPDRKPLIKMVEQQPVTGKRPKMFDYNSAEAKGGYARALKGGKRDAKGNLIDMETGLIYKDLRGKSSNPVAGKELVRMGKANQNNFYTPGGLPIPIKRNYPKTTQSTGEYQPVGLGEKYKDGTKSVAKKVTKQDYLDAAAKMTPEQRRQFHELDAKGVKFKFGDLYYTGLQKGKGGNKGGGKANTTPSATPPANTGTQTPPKNIPVVNPNTGEEQPLNIFGSRFTIRPSTIEKAALRGFNIRTANPLMKIPALAGSSLAWGLDALESLTPKESDAEKFLKTSSGIVDTGTTLLTQTPNAFQSGKMLWKGVKNPKATLQKIKELYKNKLKGKPVTPVTPASTTPVETIGRSQRFRKNPLIKF